MEDKVRQIFGSSIETAMGMAEEMAPGIAAGARKIIACLLNGKRILLCGIGNAAANCQHFYTLMLHGPGTDRPPFPVLLLNADAHTDQTFGRQIQALGNVGDLLLVLTPDGQGQAICQATNAARDRNMEIMVLSGNDGGSLALQLAPDDLEVRVPCTNLARIHEMHLFALNCFCSLIEHDLFGLDSE